MNYEALIFWILVLDCVSSNIVMWIGQQWYVHHFRIVSRLFPPAKGWPLLYAALLLWVGSLLYRMDLLFI